MKSGGTAIVRYLAREPELRNSISAEPGNLFRASTELWSEPKGRPHTSNQAYNSLCYDAVRGSYEIYGTEVQAGKS
jgi:hypothetical protein